MVDTLVMARERFPRGRKAGTVKNHKLGTLLEHIQVEHGAAHRALDDTVATAKLLNHLLRLQAEDEVASQRPTG
jgi:DNA polymerase III epsilon subunit-like protein